MSRRGWNRGSYGFERPRTEGMTDLEYIGNVALAQWDAPPPEVLRHLGLE